MPVKTSAHIALGLFREMIAANDAGEHEKAAAIGMQLAAIMSWNGLGVNDLIAAATAESGDTSGECDPADLCAGCQCPLNATLRNRAR